MKATFEVLSTAFFSLRRLSAGLSHLLSLQVTVICSLPQFASAYRAIFLTASQPEYDLSEM